MSDTMGTANKAAERTPDQQFSEWRENNRCSDFGHDAGDYALAAYCAAWHARDAEVAALRSALTYALGFVNPEQAQLVKQNVNTLRSTPKASVREFDEKFDEWFDGFETFGLSLHDIAKAGAIQFMNGLAVQDGGGDGRECADAPTELPALDDECREELNFLRTDGWHEIDRTRAILHCRERQLRAALTPLAAVSEAKRESADNSEISCPVCGYYCLGRGGVGCIDKPSMMRPLALRGAGYTQDQLQDSSDSADGDLITRLIQRIKELETAALDVSETPTARDVEKEM